MTRTLRLVTYNLQRAIHYDRIREHFATLSAFRQADIVAVQEAQVLAGGPDDARGALVRGFTRESLERKTLIANNIRAGSLDDFQGKGVLIGTRMAQRLGLRLGDELNLISPRTVARWRAFRPISR